MMKVKKSMKEQSADYTDERRWLKDQDKQTYAKDSSIICENLRHLRINSFDEGGFFCRPCDPAWPQPSSSCKGQQQPKTCSYEPRSDLTPCLFIIICQLPRPTLLLPSITSYSNHTCGSIFIKSLGR